MITATTGQNRVLFLDDHVPYPELGVGYPRSRRLIAHLRDLGHALTFIPLEFPDDDKEAAQRVLPPNVELVLGIQPAGLGSFLCARLNEFDLVLVSRPSNMRILQAALGELHADLRCIPVLYDAEAIFSAREILRYAVEGVPLSTDKQKRMLDEEMALARAATHVTAVNERDAAVFRVAGCRSVSVLGDGFQPQPTPKRFSERRDLLFVGALDDDPSPNVDALVWFVENVLPRVKARLIVAGRCAARRVRALAGPDVILAGKVDDLVPLYDAARIVVAPHRYAAGIPNKVLEAAAHGVPCVISELLAEQLGWRHGIEVLTASTADAHANAILQLCADENLWLSLREGALSVMARQFSVGDFRERASLAIERSLGR